MTSGSNNFTARPHSLLYTALY